MGQPLDDMLKVRAEINIAAGKVQLVDFDIREPLDMVMLDRDAYWLEQCLQPRPLSAQACYLDHWSDTRFKRLGAAYLLPPGETIRTRSGGGVVHSSILCHLRPEGLRQWFDGDLEWNDQRLEAALDIADSNIRGLLFRLAEEIRHPGFAGDVLAELIAGQLAIELGRYLNHTDAIPISGKLAPWRLRLIDERLKELPAAPTLEELATMCKLSVRQLTRGFRASRGCSIGESIIEARIANAKRMLAGDLSIKSIAYTLGFHSSARFCFAFRKAIGVSPGEYRTGAARQFGAEIKSSRH